MVEIKQKIYKMKVKSKQKFKFIVDMMNKMFLNQFIGIVLPNIVFKTYGVGKK